MSDFKWTGFEKGAAQIETAIEGAFTDVALQLTTEFTKTITEPGIFPQYDGDMVDTGYFRSSLNNPGLSKPPRGGSINVAPTPPVPKSVGSRLVAEFTWHAEYALALHQGSTPKRKAKKGGKAGAAPKGRPGRPWTTYTLNRFNANEAFTKSFKRLIGNALW